VLLRNFYTNPSYGLSLLAGERVAASREKGFVVKLLLQQPFAAQDLRKTLDFRRKSAILTTWT